MGAVRGWLELESTVLDVEVPSQALAQPVEYLGPATVRQGGIGHDNVGGEDREAAGHCPDVEIMHAEHAGDIADVPSDQGQVDVLRGGFQEHIGRVSKQLGCPGQDQGP